VRNTFVLLIIALVFIFRTDGQQSNLRISAYEALMEMIKNSPKDCYPVVRSTTMTILKKIEHLLAIEAHLTSATDRSQFVDLQALLCNTLTVSGAHELQICSR
jgi:importin subunit beta-1